MGIGALRYDVLVIGAGIAGSASAMAFARQGRQVLLVERSLQEPDRIVGELLQPGGVDALSDLGLAQCLEGIDAFAVKGYHLYWRGEITSFWFCPETAGRSQKPEGRSFHHGKFVNKLREAAMAQPNLTVLEATAVEILRDEGSGAVIGAICSRGGNQPEKVETERLSPSNHLSSLTMLVVPRFLNHSGGRIHLQLPIAIHLLQTKR